MIGLDTNILPRIFSSRMIQFKVPDRPSGVMKFFDSRKEGVDLDCDVLLELVWVIRPEQKRMDRKEIVAHIRSALFTREAVSKLRIR